MTKPTTTDPTQELRKQFERALAAHRRNDLAAAAAEYGALLNVDPQHVAALHMLGMLRHQQGDARHALQLLDRALSANPSQPAILANRASVQLALQAYAAAEDDARAAAQLDPQSFGAWFNLGQALRGLDRIASAASAFSRASALRPQHARALLEWFSAAAAATQTAGIAQRVHEPLPALAADRNFALSTAAQLERHGCAGAAFVLLTQLRRELPNDAEVGFQQDIEARYGAAALLDHQGRSDAALVAADALLNLAPQHRGARLLRASLLGERGEVAAAHAEYRRVVDQAGDDPIAGSALLIAMQHDPACSAAEIYAAHRDWSARHMPAPAPPWPRHMPHADPHRALRVGWVSPRFFSGLVANFFLAALEKFDRASMTHILYDGGAVDDAVTMRFRTAADVWHRVDALDDAALCERIRADRIDVLVELSGHSPGNRLRALAARPAPVQLTWLDYFHSTGTRAIGVLLSDNVLSPGELAGYYSERVLHLASGRLCYSPAQDAPAVAPRAQGPLRFASFNRINKVNDEVLATWARILNAVPESTLRLKARAFDSADESAYFLRRCQAHGIAVERIELFGYGTHADALAAYADVDIALDPFPFSGCATSLDALWMGVPVITRIGDTMVSRQSASLLRALDLPELIASDHDEYVRRAVNLATDPARRHTLRSTLRERMRNALCDADRHARELTTALRASWQLWCRGELDQADSE